MTPAVPRHQVPRYPRADALRAVRPDQLGAGQSAGPADQHQPPGSVHRPVQSRPDRGNRQDDHGGVVWNPLPRLSIALDAYHITVTDAVAQIAGSTAAYQQACYASGGTSPFCALQVRPNGYTDTSAANAVTRWYTKYYNIAEIETWGADLEVNYSATLFDRPASLRFLGAWQPHVYYRQPGAPTTDQGGVAFGPLGMAAGPDLRLTGLFRFQPAPNLTVDIMERWRDSMKLGGDPTQVWVDNHIASFATTNLTLTYEADGSSAGPSSS
jgi:iron complex outermembrane receptor protein